MTQNKIEPYTYQAKTNIQEHNDIVNKINEIVDTVNDVNLDELLPRLQTDETNIANNSKEIVGIKTDLGQLRISDNENTEQNAINASNISVINGEITEIKKVDLQQSQDINQNKVTIDALTKELPTAITLYKSGSGKIQAVVEQEDSTTLDSNILDMIIPYQYDIIPGSTNRSFKLKIVFSDGSQALTNDFLIPEGGGTDVTVTGITLTKDPTNANRFMASINLSDGTPIESGFLEMVTTVSGTFANNQLKIKVNGVESIPISIDTGVVYTQGQGIIISGGEIKIDSAVVALKTDLESKADKSTVNQIQNAVKDCFNDISFSNGSLSVTALDGQTNVLSMGTNVIWTHCTVDNLKTPSLWKVGDMLQGFSIVISQSLSEGIEIINAISMLCTRVSSSLIEFSGICCYQKAESSISITSNTLTINSNGSINLRDISLNGIAYNTQFKADSVSNAYKSTYSEIVGKNTIIDVSNVENVIAKAEIGDSFILPSIMFTEATAETTPMHVRVTSGGVDDTTLYLNTVNMTVIAKTSSSVTLNGYGRYDYTTSSNTKTATTIQQIVINSDGTTQILVAHSWKATITEGIVTKINAKIVK